MPSSDPYDLDDDELFADPQTLDQLEASALQASQAPRPRVTQPYHHTVAKPKNPPSILSSNVTFSGRKAPQPINTEPRAGNSGFGWEYGGKRSIEGNVQRHIDNVRKRHEYWSNNETNGYAPRGEEEESYLPDIVVGENGYELGENEIVDSHTTRNLGIAPPAGQSRNTEAAAARRAAILQASQSFNQDAGPSNIAGPSQSRATSVEAQKTARSQPQRAFSRSISAGHHPMAGALGAARNGRLSPIPSEDTGSLPSSQGSMARKTAIQLEEERRRSETLEKEISRLKEQLEAKRQEDARPRAMDDGGMDVDEPANQPDFQAKFDELQNKLWKAQGEASTMRRAQKEEAARTIAEADKLRQKIADMEGDYRRRKKEAARQVENVKTQAVFANHAALNSAVKARGAGVNQRPGPTPMRNGSPKGKTAENPLLQTLKGKGELLLSFGELHSHFTGRAPPPPAPRFDGFKDAFSTTPTLTRAKRQRLESVTPAPISPHRSVSQSTPPRASPQKQADVEMVSPTRKWGSQAVELPPTVLARDYADAVGMDIDLPIEIDATVAEEIAWLGTPDKRAELLYHLFHFASFSAFQNFLDLRASLRPNIYRLLNYEPSSAVDPTRLISKLCSHLLGACSDAEVGYEQLVQTIGEFGCGVLGVLCQALSTQTASYTEMSALLNVFALLGRTAALFDELSAALTSPQPLFTPLLQRLANGFNEPNGIGDLESSLRARHTVKSDNQLPVAAASEETSDDRSRAWSLELAGHISVVAQAICSHSDNVTLWIGEDLVDICMSLTAPHLPIDIVKHGIDIILMASTFYENFRPLIASSTAHPEENPVLERCSRFLIDPPKANESDTHYIVTSTVRALSMLSIADQDAIILIAERTLVVPALILLIARESCKLWGVWAETVDEDTVLEFVVQTLQLLHHLVLPIQYPRALAKPLASSSTLTTMSQRQTLGDYTTDRADPDPDPAKAPQGINLVERLRNVSQIREFQAIGHQFISALGALSYGNPVFEFREKQGFSLDSVQNMSQDILEMVVEGPEADAVYEAYAEEEDEGSQHDNAEASPSAAGGKSGRKDEVDQDVYDNMSVGDEDEAEAQWQSLIH